MTKENGVSPFTPIALDTDSHLPTTYGFIDEKRYRVSNLILKINNNYRVIYPEDIFPQSPYTTAEGVFEYRNGEALLSPATVLFRDGSEVKTQEFEHTITEGVRVTEMEKNGETIVGF